MPVAFLTAEHSVVLTLAAQLNIADPTVLSRYLEGQMRYDHVGVRHGWNRKSE